MTEDDQTQHRACAATPLFSLAASSADCATRAERCASCASNENATDCSLAKGSGVDHAKRRETTNF
eukprot:5859215-Pleurochrysis_carterae.AAC.1